jgi:hypothetical protein
VTPDVGLLLGRFVAAPAESPELPFRLRLGVTGHRTLADADSVARRAREVLDIVETRVLPHPASTRVVFTLVTALAEGADRLLSRVVLERDGSELEVLLPLAVDEFVRDFATAESRAEFTELLARATGPPQEPRRPLERPDAYAVAGYELVDRVDILVAVWDGEPARGPGGTATIVEYARARGVPTFVISTVEAGRIDVPPLPQETRPSRGGRILDRFDLQLSRQRDPSRLEHVRTSFEQLDAFNREPLPATRARAAVERERGALAAHAEPLGISPTLADWTLPVFVRADQLATLYQWVYTRIAFVVLVFAALAVTVAAAQDIYFHEHPRLILIEVALMAAVASAVFVARWRRPHDRWASYRSLAENLRSAPFIALLRSPEDERAGAANAYPLQPWFQRAFTELWRRRPETPTPPNVTQFLVNAWIDGQIEYHRKTAARFDRNHRALTLLIDALFLGTFVTALIHAFEWIDTRTLVFLAITLPAFGAAFGGYRELRQFALHAERYRRAGGRLEAVRSRLELETDPDVAQARALGAYSIMVEENLDWFGVLELQNLDIVA